jgi:glutamate carboxypeptidase
MDRPEDLIADLEARRGAMLLELIALASLNSGSRNLEGLARNADLLVEQFAPLGRIERSDLPPDQVVDVHGEPAAIAVGKLLTLSLRPEAERRILLVGHYDTVFGADHPFQHVHQDGEDTLRGPGVADLKGGLIAMRHALEVLEARGVLVDGPTTVGVDILINPDEEIGSPSSKQALAAAAGRADVGLVYEPALPDGSLVSGRKGSGNYSLVVRGRAAHAGREPHLGRNAIVAMARAVQAIADLDGAMPGATVNVGTIRGGTSNNIVPALAVVDVNIRITEGAHADWFDTQLRRLVDEIGSADGFTATLHGGFGRIPKAVTPALEELLGRVAGAGRRLGVQLGWQATGGCSDGNDLAAAGLVNVDTMGVHGGDIHSDGEWMRISSLVERAALTALVVSDLAARPLDVVS